MGFLQIGSPSPPDAFFLLPASFPVRKRRHYISCSSYSFQEFVHDSMALYLSFQYLLSHENMQIKKRIYNRTRGDIAPKPSIFHILPFFILLDDSNCVLFLIVIRVLEICYEIRESKSLTATGTVASLTSFLFDHLKSGYGQET